MNPDYAGLAAGLLPEAALVAGALAVLGVDLAWLRRPGPGAPPAHGGLRIAPCAVRWRSARSLRIGAVGEVFGGVLALDPLAVATRVGVLVLTLLVLGVSLGGRVARPPAEYVVVVLFATCGFLLMAAAQQLLVAFLALELASLSLYILAGFDRLASRGGGGGGEVFPLRGDGGRLPPLRLQPALWPDRLDRAGADLRRPGARARPSPPLSAALVMVLVAFGFKVAAAPFHLWAPDAYQGAPAPSAALIASGSKLAGFVLFTRLLWPGLGAPRRRVPPGWRRPGLDSDRRDPLRPLAPHRQLCGPRADRPAPAARLFGDRPFRGPAARGDRLRQLRTGAAVYYAATYGLATVGAFGVIAVIEPMAGGAKITDLAGLSRRSPFLAGCLLVYILSLAGVPPLAGFVGKFVVFAAALKMGGLAGPIGWLAVLAIALSAVALYYYLIVLKQALVAAPAPGASGRIRVPLAAAFALAAAAALILLLGLFPSLLLGRF